MAKEDALKLTPGSKYRITSMMTRDEPLVTEGTFKGYTMVGNIDALVMSIRGEAKEGSPKGGKGAKGARRSPEELRIVPVQVIISIDVLDQAKEKLEDEPTNSSRYYM